MQFYLPDLESTRRLARAMAEALSNRSCLVLLEGDLGAGKTTLTRLMVEALPGGNEAEVTSPSFTLCNVYPTTPEVWHYDLYRLEDYGPGMPPDDSLLEALEYFSAEASEALAYNGDSPILMLVEWPERLDPHFLPASYIHCRLTAEQNDRRASFEGHGKAAKEAVRRIGALMPPTRG